MSAAHRFGSIAALVGVGISAYLLFIRLTGGHAVCGPALGPFGGCATVETSAWSSIGPIPVAAVGLLGSMLLFSTTVLHSRSGDERALALWVLAATVGAMIELGLIAIQALLIGAWCVWCLSYGLTVFASAACALSAARVAERHPRGG